MLATGTYLMLAATATLCAIYMFIHFCKKWSSTYLLLASIIGTHIYMYIQTFWRRLRPGEPSVVKGHFLWGSAKDFNAHAVNFLQKTQKTHGDVFTIVLLNQYLTIINDPLSFEAFSKEKAFDFDPIQEQVNWNVFSFVLKDAKKMVKDTGMTVKGKFLGKGISSFVSNLEYAYSTLEAPRPLPDSMLHGEWTTDGLRVFTAKTMFNSIFNTVFGRSDDSSFNSNMVFHNFELFHRYFNMFWLGIPKDLFPKAMDALTQLCVEGNDSNTLLQRHDCSDYIKTAINFMIAQGQTEQDVKGHNLVYLHVNYNTFRLAFWILSYMLEDLKALAVLKQEINQMIESRKDEATGISTLTVGDIEGMKILNSVVQETSRISSGVFMVRYVTEDVWFKAEDSQKEYLIRKGDRVAIYPPAIHKDPEIFEEPLQFKYDRFVDANFYKNGKNIKHPVMTFGSKCPGKRFALLQLKWYIISVFSTFDMHLHEGEHAELDAEYHGHEILPPVKDVRMKYRFRCDAPRVEFSQF